MVVKISFECNFDLILPAAIYVYWLLTSPIPFLYSYGCKL